MEDLEGKIKEIISGICIDADDDSCASLDETSVKEAVQALTKLVEEELEDSINIISSLLGFFEYLVKEYKVRDINGVDTKALIEEVEQYLSALSPEQEDLTPTSEGKEDK